MTMLKVDRSDEFWQSNVTSWENILHKRGSVRIEFSKPALISESRTLGSVSRARSKHIPRSRRLSSQTRTRTMRQARAVWERRPALPITSYPSSRMNRTCPPSPEVYSPFQIQDWEGEQIFDTVDQHLSKLVFLIPLNFMLAVSVCSHIGHNLYGDVCQHHTVFGSKHDSFQVRRMSKDKC